MQRLRQSPAHSSLSPSRAPSITQCRGLVIAFAPSELPFPRLPRQSVRVARDSMLHRTRKKYVARHGSVKSAQAWASVAGAPETSDRYIADRDPLYMGACSKVAAQNRALSLERSYCLTVFTILPLDLTPSLRIILYR